ncbi:MAG: NAD(P)H-dependent oxidoreductase subunit E [Bacteroidales bacterium]
MEKILVEICVGTSCYVMGASELMMVQEQFTPEQKAHITFKGTTCLDTCLNPACGRAPFVRLNGEIIPEVTVPILIAKIEDALTQLR